MIQTSFKIKIELLFSIFFIIVIQNIKIIGKSKDLLFL